MNHDTLNYSITGPRQRGKTMKTLSVYMKLFFLPIFFLTFIATGFADVKSLTNQGISFIPAPNGSANMILTSNGLLGVGTLTPSANLHVTGNSIFGSNILFSGPIKPKRSIILEAGSAFAAGNAQQTFNTGTYHSFSTVQFPPSVSGNAYWHWIQQNAYDPGSTITVTLYWSSTASSTTSNWTVSTSGVSLGGAIDGAYEGTNTSASTSSATANTMTGATFSAFDPGWARGDYIIFRVGRNSNDSGTAHLHFVKIDYSVSELSD